MVDNENALTGSEIFSGIYKMPLSLFFVEMRFFFRFCFIEKSIRFHLISYIYALFSIEKKSKGLDLVLFGLDSILLTKKDD